MRKMKRRVNTSLGEVGGDARSLLEEACDLFESGERTRSVKLFLRAAKLGSPEAQVNLANLYDEGDGVRADFDKARHWYKRAIAAGCAEAAHNLGVGYFNGGNARWARHWLLVAKSMGDEDAEEWLGRLG